MQADLSAAMGVISGVVGKSATLPILGNVLFEASGSGLSILATDLEIAVRTTVPAKVDRPGSITLPAAKLAKFVGLLPDVDIDVDVKGDVANLRASRSKTRMPGLSSDAFPEIKMEFTPAVVVNSADLARLFRLCLLAVSAEETRFTLNGGCFSVVDGQLTVVSTDGHRLILAQAGENVPEFVPMLVSKRAMQMALKLIASLDDGVDVEIGSDDNHHFFKIGQFTLLARRMTGNFPDYKRILPKHKRSGMVNRAELLESVKRSLVLADLDTTAIRLTVADGTMTVNLASTSGENSEDLPFAFNGALTTGFNGYYLADILQAVPDEELAVFLGDEMTAADFRFAGGRYVVMPMRTQ
jgi:DNA polymerase-3 subunit beta